MPVGRIFQVITRGYGGMPAYAGQIAVDDRWAIIAYVRLLQYSQNVPAADLTDADRAKLQTSAAIQRKSEGAGGH
jgi:mono/diheme cytochrome c family protein